MWLQNLFHTILKVDIIVIPIKTFQRRTKYPYLYFLRRDLQFFTFFSWCGFIVIVSSMEMQQNKMNFDSKVMAYDMIFIPAYADVLVTS